MRTTVTIDDDVADRIKELVGKQKKSSKEIINNALRIGIDSMESPPAVAFQTESVGMGWRPGLNYDRIGQLIGLGEGEDFR